MSNVNIYVGIDPGKTGAIAILSRFGGLLHAEPLPYIADDLDVRGVICGVLEVVRGAMLDGSSVSVHVAIEKVASRPGQGVSSVFRFGLDTGKLHGAVLAQMDWALHTPTPQTWQKVAGGPTKGDKAITAAWVARLYPTAPIIPKRCRVVHTGVTDAIGIAYWLWQKNK